MTGLALGLPGQALAQDTAPAVASARSFDIPAQPLTEALIQFGRQAGLQASADAGLVRTLSSAPVRGAMTWQQALTALLSGTGLVWRVNGALVTVEAPTAGGADMTLDTIVVQGQGGGTPGGAIGMLPPPAPGGQVAQGSRLGLLGERDVMDTPFSQTSYTAQLIQDQQARTIADVVANDPSVRSVRGASAQTDEFTIRGLQYFNRDITLNGLYGIVPNFTVPAELAERVEILKGPNALLNGIAPSGSLGGGINIAPKRASDTPVTQLTLGYEADTTYRGHVDIGRRFGPDNAWGVRFNGSYRSGDSAVDHNGQDLGLVALGLDYQGERFRLDADLGYQTRDQNGHQALLVPNAGLGELRPPDGTSNIFQDWNFFDTEHSFGAIRGEFDITPDWTAYGAIGGSSDTFRTRQASYLVQSADGAALGVPRYSESYTDVLTGEVGLRGRFETGPVDHSVAVSGSSYGNEVGQVNRSAATFLSNLYDPAAVPVPAFAPITSVPKASETTLRSIALADTLAILDERVLLTLGVRHQRVEARGFNPAGDTTTSYSESALTPAVGLVVKPWEHVSLYANYIEGLQQGPTAPNTAANANEVFPPSKSEQIEAGVKVEAGALTFTASAFEITRPNSFTNPVTNVFGIDGEQRNRGVELNTFGEIAPGLRILGGVTFVDAIQASTLGGINDGKRAVGVSDVQLNLGAEWDLAAVPGLTLSGRVIHASGQSVDEADTTQIGDWTRLDLGMRYRFEAAGTPVTVRANVENLLDEDYWAGALYMGAPRTVFVSLTLDY